MLMAQPGVAYYDDELTGPSSPGDSDADDEVEMQVHHDDGFWHRRTRDQANTACGQTLYRRGKTLRQESYEEPLCPKCFTAFEHELSAALAERARMEKEALEEKFLGLPRNGDSK